MIRALCAPNVFMEQNMKVMILKFLSAEELEDAVIVVILKPGNTRFVVRFIL
jgi:hypothetical protein